MTEDRHRIYDIAIKLFGSLALLLGAWIGIWEYGDAVEKDFRKPLWEKHLEVYFDVVSSAAIIATNSNEAERDKAEAQFWKYYYGPLAMVEDPKVVDAMVEFGDCLRSECESANLRAMSLRLAHACRDSLASLWSVPLDELPDRLNI